MSTATTTSLAAWLQGGQTASDPIGLARQWAEALAALHQSGQVHGNLHPDTVFLEVTPGAAPRATLGRFTPQAGDPSLDVAALGQVLLTLTGLRPEELASARTVLQSPASDDTPRATTSYGALLDLIQRMVAPEAAKRPAMAEVVQELARLSPESGPASAPNRKNPIGQIIGSYRIVDRLGAGGMGEVFEAQHTRLSRRAAIKLLHSALSLDPDMVSRFFTEAESVNLVQHPGIVNIFEFGQLADQTVYIVMEFLAGDSLAQRLERSNGRLGVDAVRLVRQVASALAAAHARGIIHRDLKPENVMIVADPDVPGGERTKLLDFGIAKMAAETYPAPSGHATQAGIMMGTPSYMSPEQIQDTGSVNDRADVYSLGIMLYQALAGRLPFSAPSFFALATLHFTAPPPPLKDIDATLPDELCALVEHMLAKRAEDRPSMHEVALRLEQFLSPSQRSSAPTTSFTVPAAPPPRRPLIVGLGLAALVLAAGGATVALTLSTRRPAPPAPRVVIAAPDLAPPAVNLPGLREQSLGVVSEGLRDADPGMRRRAAALLGQSRDVRVAPLGEPLLSDADPVVQSQAAEALWQLGARASVPALLSALSQPRLPEALRVELAGALLLLGEPQGEHALRRALRAKDERARDRAVLYLASRGDKEARRLLLAAPLRDGDEDQLQVLGRLARFGDSEALAVLQRGQAPADAKLDDNQLRVTAELARCDDEGARRRLEGLARAAGPQQLHAARLLAQLDDPSFYDLFSGRFRDRGATLPERTLAAEGLGATGRRAGAALLGEVLPKDLGGALRLRLSAAGGILQIVASDPELLAQQGLAAIQQRLSDRSTEERAGATAALGSAEPSVAVPLLAQEVKDPQPAVRQSAARALGNTGARAAVPVLTAVLDDHVPVVRRQAIASMGRLGEHLRQRGEPVDEVVKSMAGRAEQGDVQDRLASVATLVRLGDDSHQRKLQEWMHAPEADVRQQALETSAASKSADAQDFVSALTDKAFAVRFAAATALARRGRGEGAAVLREGLDHPGRYALLARALLLRLGQPVPGAAALAAGPLPLEERVQQVEAIGELPVREALALLVQAARDAALAVRLKVIDVLVGSPALRQSAQARRIMRALLADPEPLVRTQAGLVYGRFHPEAPTPEPEPAPPPSPDLGAPPAPDLAPLATVEPPPAPVVKTPPPPSKGEQALSDAIAAFEAGDLSKAQALLAQARGLLKAKLSKAQAYNLGYYQGLVHERQGHFSDAMIEYERLAERAPAAQRAQLQEAVDRTATHLGRIQVSETVDGACQTKALWLPPGSHVLDVEGKSREIRVRAGETLKVTACTP